MFFIKYFYILFLLYFTITVQSGTPDDWKGRTIYQVITDRFAKSDSGNDECSDLTDYCGGTFKGIIHKLDYIQNMGFDSIWISPVVSQIDSPYPGYHGYYAKDLYDINPRFGTKDDLKELSSELSSRSMYLMVDVVPNHMGITTDISVLNPFNDPQHYHDCQGCDSNCLVEDWQNQFQVEHCRPGLGLYDLNQDNNQYVANELNKWIKSLIDEYNIDGLRYDTVPEICKPFWKSFQEAAGIYGVGEVFNNNLDYVSGYQQVIDGVMSYPLFFVIRDIFINKKSMYGIQNSVGPDGIMRKTFKDMDLLGTFIDNHDNNRFLSESSDLASYKNALIFTLFAEGIPIIYYGTEQGFSGGKDPKNRETLWTSNYNTDAPLYKFLTTAISNRKKYKVWESKFIQRYTDDDFYAFTRGDTNDAVLILLTNVGTDSIEINRILTYIPYDDDITLCEIYNPSDCISVTGGSLSISLTNGLPKIYIKK